VRRRQVGGVASLVRPPIPHPALPRLTSVPNFRDLAGGRTGYLGHGGRPVRTRTFFRAGELTLDADDLAAVAKYGLTRVYDLRRPQRVAERPGVPIPGAPVRNVSLFGSGLDFAVDVSTLTRVTTEMVAGEVSRHAMAELLTDLAAAPGPVLFHCTQGKDRTGWVAALLLGLAGVPESDIVTNYLLTNSYSASLIAGQYDEIEGRSGSVAADSALPLLGAQARMLRLALRTMAELGGDYTGYVHDALGLPASTVRALQVKLLD
jgi:protein-tyrosine phosphatase